MLPRNWREQRFRREWIATGEKGRVYALHPRGMVRKEFHEVGYAGWPKAKWEPTHDAQVVFYTRKIAEALLPKQVLTYSFARKKVARGERHSPSFVEGKLIPTTEGHRAFVKWFYGHKQLNIDFKSVPSGPATEHYVRVGSLDVKERIKNAQRMGVVLSDHPVNVDFIGGRPFFFEVLSLDEEKVRRAAEGHPKEEQIIRWLAKIERFKEACTWVHRLPDAPISVLRAATRRRG